MKILDWIVRSVMITAICSALVIAAYLFVPPLPQQEVDLNGVVSSGSMSLSIKENNEVKINTLSPSDIACLIGVLFLLFVLYLIFKNGYWAILVFGVLGLALIGLIFWILLFRAGDVSTTQARDENLQVLRVVQPMGDPAVDQIYAKVNRENARTNVVNSVSVLIYTVLIWVTVIVFFGIGIFLWYFTHK